MCKSLICLQDASEIKLHINLPITVFFFPNVQIMLDQCYVSPKGIPSPPHV